MDPVQYSYMLSWTCFVNHRALKWQQKSTWASGRAAQRSCQVWHAEETSINAQKTLRDGEDICSCWRKPSEALFVSAPNYTNYSQVFDDGSETINYRESPKQMSLFLRGLHFGFLLIMWQSYENRLVKGGGGDFWLLEKLLLYQQRGVASGNMFAWAFWGWLHLSPAHPPHYPLISDWPAVGCAPT